MRTVSKWPGRVALLISMAAVAAIVGTFDAYGLPIGVPVALQTSGSPKASPSPSVSCAVPQVPQTCRTITPSSSGSSTASPSSSPTGGPTVEKHDSTLSIDYGNSKFSGKVTSASKCKPQRQVVVRKLKSGPDPVVGRDTTNARGKYSFSFGDAKGKYYAKVAKRIFTQGSTRVECGADRSKTITVA